MNTNNNPHPNGAKTSDQPFPEAPASWNTKYVDPSGFECQITLRAENGLELLEKAKSAIAYLLKSGCIPSVFNKGNNHQPKPNGTSEPSDIPGTNGNEASDHSWCSIHQVEMRKWQKDGKVWYSHKIGNTWCSGKAKTR